ncbi:MAG: phosphoglucosamine mutase [Fusobacteriaceae bacterium]|jgi:phosphoglucosamine mutase|nr:phosphoglucosamine mutase [Fusobacteriaceae bacterium]
MKKYFGTDGIRGEANKELTIDVTMRLGYALGYYLKNKKPKNKIKIILGSDTRISGYMLCATLIAGLTSMGVNVDFVGIIPTPAVAYLTKINKADAGIMVSASHNPAKDNGLKIFGSDGYKLLDEVEEEIETLMENYSDIIKNPISGDEVGKFRYAEDEYDQYKKFLISTVKNDFSSMKIILDAANGASYKISKEVFLALGAEIVVINDAPSGVNINVNCGSTKPEILSKVVVGYNADLGLAYDGDADRLIAVDRHGKIVDGDKIIATLAIIMKKNGKLIGNKVVTTVMSNMGLEKYLEQNGITLLRSDVGDRYVLEKMLKEKVIIGGEQSGHIILSDFAVTGDGILTSLKLVDALIDEKKYLDEIVEDIKDWPQVLINVNVNNEKKKIWDKNKNIMDIIDRCEKKMGKNGRILVRTSGTEPLVRVMVEGSEKEVVTEIAENIANVVKKELK